MALALAQYEDLFCLVNGYLYGTRENICMPPCMSLEIIFPMFVRTCETCMHHDKSLFHTCIIPPLINL